MNENLRRSNLVALAMGLLFTLTFQDALSQQTVSGKVTDDAASPLPGVNIIVEGSSTGTTTDADGEFTLSVNSSDAVLVFSFIGYTSQRVPVGIQTAIDVSLLPDLKTLEEIVVVGYGSMPKRDVTGAIASVGAKTIAERVPTNVFDALQGQVAGLQIVSESSRPGAGSTVRIRGTGTIQGGADPLYIIDGAQARDPNGINPNDIASIEVLKDAASAAIYGVQAANGVIIITTKKGVEGKPRFDVNYLRTYSKIANKIPQATADERRLFDIKRSSTGTASVQLDSLNPSFNADNDMLDYITRTAVRDQVDLSVSGAAKGFNFYTSLGYLGEEGVILNSWSKTLRNRINIDYTDQRFSIGGRLNFSYTDENRINESNTLIQAIQRPPTFRVYFPDGTIAPVIGGRRNPVADALLRKNEYDIYRGSLFTYLGYKITDFLKITTDFQFRLNDEHRNYFEPKLISTSGINSGGNAEGIDLYWISQTYLNFEKSFGEHDVTAVLGTSADKNVDRNQQIEGSNYVTEIVNTTNAIQLLDQTDTFTNEERYTTVSFFGRVGYSFKGRYIFNASLRRDGSSKFGKNNRWGNFPGVSVGWRFSNEPFMNWATRVLDDGKFRVSYGETGNASIPEYASIQQYTFGSNFYNGVSGVGPSATFGNADLSWERTRQINAGIDLSFFNNRATLTVDYYNKITDNLLYEAPLPTETGFNNVFVNVGSIGNKGIEVALGVYPIDRGNFRWHTTFNITFNNDEVRELYGGIPITPANQWYVETGGRLGNFYGYQYKGVYPYDESNAYTESGEMLTLVVDGEGNIVTDGNGDPTYLLNGQSYSGTVAQLRGASGIFKGGDVIWQDLNGDGLIDNTDRMVLGNAQPEFYMGWGNTVTYKNFSLAFNFYVNWGNKIYDKARRDTYVMSPTNITPQPYFIHRSWNQPGDVTDIWISRNTPHNLQELNSYFLEDGSFIRLRNVRLSYQLGNNIASLLHLKGLSAYIYGSNLLTWTNYLWFDPEININNPLQMGRDTGAYPRKREFGAGINIGL